MAKDESPKILSAWLSSLSRDVCKTNLNHNHLLDKKQDKTLEERCLYEVERVVARAKERSCTKLSVAHS